MSITYTYPKTAKRSAQIDASWQRSYVATLRAKTTDPRIGPLQVLRACPVGIGTPYREENPAGLLIDGDFGSWAQSILVEDDAEDQRQWRVTINYGPRAPVDENPLNRKPEVTWDFQPIDKIVDEDLDGNAVLNTAYDYFDPPLTRPVFLPTLTVRRNEAQYPYGLAFSFEDGTNGADFLATGDAGKWKVLKISAASQAISYTPFGSTTAEVLLYWVVTYELQYNPDGWKREILNQGMRQLKTGGGGWEPILDKGQPISSPALLDSAGRVLPPGGDPVFLQFTLNPTVDFSTLNFAGIDFGQGPL